MYEIKTFKDLIKTTQDKRLILKVGAPWCKPCVDLDPYYDIYSKKFDSKELVWAKADFDSLDEEVKTNLKIENIPVVFAIELGLSSKQPMVFSKHVGGNHEALLKFIKELTS